MSNPISKFLYLFCLPETICIDDPFVEIQHVIYSPVLDFTVDLIPQLFRKPAGTHSGHRSTLAPNVLAQETLELRPQGDYGQVINAAPPGFDSPA